MRQKEELADRVARAAERALAHQHYVSPLDVLLGIGWVDGGTVKRWQKGQIDCLEAVLQARPARIAEALRLLLAWAQAHDLSPSEAPHLAALHSAKGRAPAPMRAAGAALPRCRLGLEDGLQAVVPLPAFHGAAVANRCRAAHRGGSHSADARARRSTAWRPSSRPGRRGSRKRCACCSHGRRRTTPSPSEAPHLAATPRRETLRFSRSADAETERQYRTQWVSTALPAKARKRLDERAARAPELVVIKPLNDAWTCQRCGGTGEFLVMENPGPACLRCVGLDDLEFLPAGNTLLTRRAKAGSARHAVVVRFSKTRGRYERQGLLIEPAALAQARHDIEQP